MLYYIGGLIRGGLILLCCLVLIPFYLLYRVLYVLCYFLYYLCRALYYVLYYFLYCLWLFVSGVVFVIVELVNGAYVFFRGPIQKAFYFISEPVQKVFYFINRKGGALLKKRAQRLALQKLKERRTLLIRKLETQTPGPPSSPFRLQGLDGSSSAAQILGRETIPESAREDVAQLQEIEDEMAELEAQRRSAHS